jgi:protein-disulfide isomerase
MKRLPILVFNLLLIVAPVALSTGWWFEHRRFTATSAALEELRAERDGAEPRKNHQPERQYLPLTGVPKGAANAPITIVEFVDFQCRFCRGASETIDRVFKEYLGKIRFYVRHSPLPYHVNAPLAAQAALAAGEQGKFWEMHDKLIDNQKKLAREDIETYAKEIGLDIARFIQAIDAQTHQPRIEKDLAMAEQLNARGTPTFFINGRKLVGAQSFEAFKAVIDDELSRVDALIENGTPPERLYDALTNGERDGNQRLRR